MNSTLQITGTIATLLFDRANSNINLLDSHTLAEISTHLDQLSQHTNITALIFRSAKSDSFLDDSDLNEITSSLTENAQAILNRIADLPFPTIAAIHGTCIGTGYELALACDWRIASDSKSTTIGLPQVKNGLIPAWGGTTRLTNLIGLQEALHIILPAIIIDSETAKLKGLIDETVPFEHLETFVLSQVAKGRRILTHNPIIHNQAVAKIVQIQTQKELLKLSHPLSKAPGTALDVAVFSIGHSRIQSLLNELNALTQLVSLPKTKQLIRIHQIEKDAIKSLPSRTKRISILGTDTTSTELLRHACTNDIHTTLIDSSDESLASALSALDHEISDLVRQHCITSIQASRSLDNIHPSPFLDTPIHRSEFIILPIIVDLPNILSRAHPEAIIALSAFANPISLHLSSSHHPERIIGIQFHPNRIVEVIPTSQTSEHSLSTTLSFFKHIGYIPIITRDSPGFLINRILTPYLLKSIELFEQGGDPNEIDQAMLDFGMAIGPLSFIDMLGLDSLLDIATIFSKAFPNRIQIPDILSKLIDQEYTGRKKGSGFFVYDDQIPAVNAQAIELQTNNEPIPSDTSSLLSNLITTEAKLCLKENITQSADNIDLAIILGAGYPPHLGGPLTYQSTEIVSS